MIRGTRKYPLAKAAFFANALRTTRSTGRRVRARQSIKSVRSWHDRKTPKANMKLPSKNFVLANHYKLGIMGNPFRNG
jgi:hypothetical protein